MRFFFFLTSLSVPPSLFFSSDLFSSAPATPPHTINQSLKKLKKLTLSKSTSTVLNLETAPNSSDM